MIYRSSIIRPIRRPRVLRFWPRWLRIRRFKRSAVNARNVVTLTLVACFVIGLYPEDALAPRLDTAAQTASVSGHVTHVRDGDTIEIGDIAIRFETLDCAEGGTLAGDTATRRMKALVRNERVTCKLIGRRSYDREIGNCQLSDGRDLADQMMSTGTCARYW